MAEAKPRQILEDAIDIFGTIAAGIEILDPQAESPAACPGMVVAQHRGIGMAEV
jgi:hypothetical protein